MKSRNDSRRVTTSDSFTCLRAARLPSVSRAWAACRVSRRVCSIMRRHSAIQWATTSCTVTQEEGLDYSVIFPSVHWVSAVRKTQPNLQQPALVGQHSLTCWYRCFPNVLLEAALWQSSSSASSAKPTALMQWCSLPGPRRPWAISNPRPSPGVIHHRTERWDFTRKSCCVFSQDRKEVTDLYTSYKQSPSEMTV